MNEGKKKPAKGEEGDGLMDSADLGGEARDSSSQAKSLRQIQMRLDITIAISWHGVVSWVIKRFPHRCPSFSAWGCGGPDALYWGWLVQQGQRGAHGPGTQTFGNGNLFIPPSSSWDCWSSSPMCQCRILRNHKRAAIDPRGRGLKLIICAYSCCHRTFYRGQHGCHFGGDSAIFKPDPRACYLCCL